MTIDDCPSRLARAIRTLTLAALVFSTPIHAATEAHYLWRNVVVGAGGFAPNIIFSRRVPGLAYLRTDMGGLYRWDRSSDQWTPLQDGMPQSSYFGIESVALDPIDPDVVYVAAGMYYRDNAAILRSHNRGKSWEVFPTPFRMGGNEDGRGVGERLAVDPQNRAVLYFGSRHDGLQRSTDRGQTWARVESFPVHGLGAPPPTHHTHAGISFIVFDSSAPKSHTLWVGVADAGEQHLFQSDDSGVTWHSVAGQPRADLLPVRAELDERGVLYIAYSNGVGPNGVTDGAVYKYDSRAALWTDITPEKGPARPPGGYMGLSLDHQHPDTLIVASLNRWRPGDSLWRSTDGGRTWRNLRDTSSRDVSTSPFLLWGQEQADFGWWMAGVAIDPFDSTFAAYTTGATVYATHDLQNASLGWRPWVRGIEQTAVITLASPPAGPALLSGFGDISGFAHEDLDTSPSEQFTNPVFSNTNTIDYAGLAPQVVVRSGTPAPRNHSPDVPTLAFSTDFGRTWSPLITPSSPLAPASATIPAPPFPRIPDRFVTTSADGSVFLVTRLDRAPPDNVDATPPAGAAAPGILTRDRGKTWSAVAGLPPNTRAVADRARSQTFYAVDFDHATVLVSEDGGTNFSALPTTGLPADLHADRPTWREAPWPLIATPGLPGDLWFVSRAGLYHSTDGGRSFARTGGSVSVTALSFGKAPAGRNYPALFALGVAHDVDAIWRSDDAGHSWLRINDERHEYGRRFRCISGDPRVFGRVYVGTDGRGIIYGEPAPR